MDLFSLLSDVIDNIELPLCDLSLVVRYLKSCITLMTDVDSDQVSSFLPPSTFPLTSSLSLSLSLSASVSDP
jgi:hypothetical protein